ncbi:MAG: hypothetical protein HKP43_06470 [Altererythrobacter sp.]|nr:hypothetical protein [Altererythrobacter sp.]MBT8432496.1 hypothetical protein [Altererythrobacter sp.]NNE49000.1 hypothetical protein [Altererythrobacter sp.]NNF93408.1 hypothetical protein [Altererythrobacter sp.]NNK46252.1 hypothetical protein [Altererythrobacter sp.]
MLHPNLISHTFEWEDEGAESQPKLVCVIKTNAVILPNSGGIDSGALDDMMAAVREAYPNEVISKFRISAA